MKMTKLTHRISLLLALSLFAACTSTTVNPALVNIAAEKIPLLEFGQPFDVRATLTGAGEREVEGSGGASFIISDDKFTVSLVEGIREELEKRGASLDSRAERVVQLRVVHVSVHPGPPRTCVIDYNVKLSDASSFGFQSRGVGKKGAPDGSNRVSAFDKALTQAVIDVLNEGSMVTFLEVPQ